MHQYICIFIYVYICMYICMYTHIYMCNERQRANEPAVSGADTTAAAALCCLITSSILARPLLRPGGRNCWRFAILMISPTSTSIICSTSTPLSPSESSANIPLATLASASPATTTPRPPPSLKSVSSRLTAIRTIDTQPGTLTEIFCRSSVSVSPFLRAISSPSFTCQRQRARAHERMRFDCFEQRDTRAS